MELLHAQNALDDADKDAFLDQLLKRLVPSSIPTILTRVSAKRLFRGLFFILNAMIAHKFPDFFVKVAGF